MLTSPSSIIFGLRNNNKIKRNKIQTRTILSNFINKCIVLLLQSHLITVTIEYVDERATPLNVPQKVQPQAAVQMSTLDDTRNVGDCVIFNTINNTFFIKNKSAKIHLLVMTTLSEKAMVPTCGRSVVNGNGLTAGLARVTERRKADFPAFGNPT